MHEENLTSVLKKVKFINVATSDAGAIPFAAPKFLLKADDEFIYLADYTLGATYRNLLANPHISLSFMTESNLKGYQVNGTARIIESGSEYAELIKELKDKEVKLTVERLIDGIRREKAHDNYEIELSTKIAFFKIKIKDFVVIKPRGELVKGSVSGNPPAKGHQQKSS